MLGERFIDLLHRRAVHGFDARPVKSPSGRRLLALELHPVQGKQPIALPASKREAG